MPFSNKTPTPFLLSLPSHDHKTNSLLTLLGIQDLPFTIDKNMIDTLFLLFAPFYNLSDPTEKNTHLLLKMYAYFIDFLPLIPPQLCLKLL